MAARSKKRPSKTENKLLKLDKLQFSDLLCSICQSILIEPVTLPCFHDFCLVCFNGTIENNALCCPLCRMRIGSWLRTTTKLNKLVNTALWNFINCKYSSEVCEKLNGEDTCIIENNIVPRLSAPGEIHSEYQAELQRARTERIQLEQKHAKETELLIRELQEQEQKEQEEYLKKIKQDELLAKRLCQASSQSPKGSNISPEHINSKRFYKSVPNDIKGWSTIDHFLTRKKQVVQESPLLTDDNSSISTTPDTKCSSTIQQKVPSTVNQNDSCYGRFLKDYLDRKLKKMSSANEKKCTPKVWEPSSNNRKSEAQKEFYVGKCSDDLVQSIPVSLPYSTLLAQKVGGRVAAREISKQSSATVVVVDTDSEDSMRQELCYFKPIHGTKPTVKSISQKVPLPLRTQSIDAECVLPESIPRDVKVLNYLDGLRKLRRTTSFHGIPSAFVCLISPHNNADFEMKSKVGLESRRKSTGTQSRTAKAKIKKSNICKMANQSASSNREESTKLNISVDQMGNYLAETQAKTHVSMSENLEALSKDANCNNFNDLKKPKPIFAHSPTMVPEPCVHFNLTKHRISVTKTNSSPVNNGSISDIAMGKKIAENNNNNTGIKKNTLHMQLRRRTSTQLASPNSTGDFPIDKVVLNSIDDMKVNNDISPTKSDHVVFSEQLKLENLIQQEKRDLELAIKMQKHWDTKQPSGGYTLRRNPKRQLSIRDMMQRSKKVKV